MSKRNSRQTLEQTSKQDHGRRNYQTNYQKNYQNNHSGKKTIVVFTDGSCAGNGRIGAVGGIGIHFPNGELHDLSKVFTLDCCTNQRTELYAILTALRYIKQKLGIRKYKVYIKTDSQYSIDCVTKWIYGWIKNGWLTKNNTSVANREFIEKINEYYERYDITFVHVDAHTGMTDADSIANAKADELATMATKKALKMKDKICPRKKTVQRAGSKTDFVARAAGSTRTTVATRNYVCPNIRRVPAKNGDIVVELIKSKK